MTIKEILNICNPVEVSGDKPEQFGDLTQDSRQVVEGSVFIAIRGTHVDGHRFIEEAVSQGAAVIICEDLSFLEGKTNVFGIKVENSRAVISPLAQAFEGNPAKELTLIGVTGTNGKTTVVTLVYQILKSIGVRVSMLGTIARQILDETFESRLTTSGPIELARDMRRMVDSGSTHLVMEVSSHALDQQRVNGLNFKVAAFTNLSHDHLDYHGTAENYASAKKRLFDNLSEHDFAVINGDDSKAGYVVRDCRANIVDFGFRNESTVSCELVSNNAEGLKIRIDDINISSTLVGEFNAYNVVSAFLICSALGFERQHITTNLMSATGAPGRMERVRSEQTRENQPLVFVDYAHTPDALENVLKTVDEMKTASQKIHVVFGCGGDRDRSKRPVMANIAERFSDKITVTSDNPRSEDPRAIIEEILSGFEDRSKVTAISDRREAIRKAIREADKDTIILIAGKGHETYQEVKGVRHPFDDRIIAGKALGKRNGNTKPEEVA